MTASNSFLLPSALQTCLQEIIDTANMSQAGIRAILLCTTEGVPLGRVLSEQTMHPDMLQMIESAFAPSSKQFPVLELEKLKQVTAFYDHGIVVHQYHGPVVVTILCKAASNLGAVRSIATPLLKQALEPLCSTLEKSLKAS